MGTNCIEEDKIQGILSTYGCKNEATCFATDTFAQLVTGVIYLSFFGSLWSLIRPYICGTLQSCHFQYSSMNCLRDPSDGRNLFTTVLNEASAFVTNGMYFNWLGP